jgi:hypothetical protein
MPQLEIVVQAVPMHLHKMDQDNNVLTLIQVSSNNDQIQCSNNDPIQCKVSSSSSSSSSDPTTQCMVSSNTPQV